MSIPVTDIKILWANAAGRCSMPLCRAQLTEISNTMLSGAVIFGENCHIVGESIDGPRGQVPMAEGERNRYPNLILLCSNHHKMIDSDVTAWPVQKLQEIKKQHENWVQSSLQQQQSLHLRVYQSIVIKISNFLHFDTWDGISDHAIRNLAYIPWISGIYDTNLEVSRANWNQSIPDLENSIFNLRNRAMAYADNYMKLALRPSINNFFYQEDRNWKHTFCTDYDKYQSISEAWRNENMRLLLNLNHAMNEFSDTVRIHLDPSFFLEKGKFCIHDSLGVTNNLYETWILPHDYK